MKKSYATATSDSWVTPLQVSYGFAPNQKRIINQPGLITQQ